MKTSEIQLEGHATCRNCLYHGTFILRPDAAMQNATDEIVCRSCGEAQ